MERIRRRIVGELKGGELTIMILSKWPVTYCGQQKRGLKQLFHAYLVDFEHG